MIDTRARFAVNFLIAVFSCIATVLVLEIAAWLLLSRPDEGQGLAPNEIEDEQLIWWHRPGFSPNGGVDGPINSYRFRGKEFSLQKSKETFRILSLGESTTYGSRIEWHETYSHQLEERLQNMGFGVEVLNAGVRAWSTFQSAQLLGLVIDELEPDLVLVYHEVNDFLPTAIRGVHLPGADLDDTELLEQKRSWLRRISRRSHLLTAAGAIRARSQRDAVAREVAEQPSVVPNLYKSLPYASLPNARGEENPWLDNDNGRVRLPDPKRAASLRKLITLTRARGSQLVFLHPSYRVSRPHRCLLTRIADEEGIPVLEIDDIIRAEAVRTERRKRDLFFPKDPFHPNAEGHAVIGREVARFLVEQGLLGRQGDGA